MAPVLDRDRSIKDIYSVNLTSNVLPQHARINQGVWQWLERDSRTFIEASGNNKELYIIAGGAGYEPATLAGYPDRVLSNHIFQRTDGTVVTGNAIAGTYTKVVPDAKVAQISPNFPPGFLGNNSGAYIPNPKNIQVPSYTWKIVAALQPGQGLADITTSTSVLAVLIANKRPNNSSTSPGTWDFTIPIPAGSSLPSRTLTINQSGWTRDAWQWLVSIDELEAITNYDFLSNVPEPIQTVIENRVGGYFLI